MSDAFRETYRQRQHWLNIVARVQTWLCVVLCNWAEKAHCTVTGHPVQHVRPGVRWCGRCGVAV